MPEITILTPQLLRRPVTLGLCLSALLGARLLYLLVILFLCAVRLSLSVSQLPE